MESMDEEDVTMVDHPSDEKLIAYAGDELARGEIAAVADHVIACLSCTGTVSRYRLVRDLVRADGADALSPLAVSRAKALFTAATTAAARDVLAPLRRIMARLVFDSGAGLSPALAGFRGGGDRQLTYEAGEIEVDVQIQPPAELGGAWRVLGQVTADSDVRRTFLELVPAGRDKPLADTVADEHGVFSFTAPAGQYDIVARGPDAVLVLPGLELG